jgi:hypothetical protein
MLRVTSIQDLFKNFINRTKMDIYDSYEKGEKSKIGLKKEYNDYGFSCVISEKEWNDFKG